MADRPTMSMSRTGRPRMRSRSVHIPSHIPIASKAGKCRTASAQRIPTKGKGAGKGKKATKKSNKAVAVVSSDSEDLEVDFPHYHPNQPHEVPAELPQQPNQPADAPTEEQQEPGSPSQMIPLKNIPQMLQWKMQNNHKIQVTQTHYQYSHPCTNGKQSIKLVLTLDLSFQGHPMKMQKHIC